MPATILPTITQDELAAHRSARSCYVAIGRNVYDITPFLDDHPGGAELILEHAGTDVGAILADEISHQHSDAAYEILDDHRVAFLATDASASPSDPAEQQPVATAKQRNAKPVYANTGMSSAEDLSVETDAARDYRTHKFLDLNRPLFMQVWQGGFSKDFYLEQVHRPRHYKGGASAPLFGNFLEPLSKTPWWVVPMVWLPPVVYGTVLSRDGLATWFHVAGFWLLGLALWTLIEYGLHRGLFHMDKYLPDNRVGITAHFLLHGIHHYLPMDKLRLVMPPTLFFVLALPFWRIAHTIIFWNWHAATAAYCGGIFGYICYDLTHYFLHHRQLPAFYRELKRYHLQHHFADYENGFGVSSRFWDKVFGTELSMPGTAKAA